MQPKPIESRRLLDIDAQKRTVDMETTQHLRSLRGDKEHPAETDYDIVHDEESRRNQEQTADQLSRKLKKIRGEYPTRSQKSPAEEPSREKNIRSTGKGAHLDVEA